MVEAALGGRFASKFVDGKEELLQCSCKMFCRNTGAVASCRCIAVGSNRQQQYSRSASSACRCAVRETTGPDVINHVDLERSTTNCKFGSCCTLGTASRAG